MNKLSIIIITKNESQNIADCINSANFADEIIVLDSKSSDDTVSISKKLGAKVFIRSWRGYGAQKNLAIKFCRGDWVLSLDADERISKSLKMEIQTVLKDPKFSAYAIQRRSYFLSKIIKFSGWRSDKVLRLFIKGKAMYSNDRVHERLLYKEKIGFLKGHIIHHSYRNLDSVLNKINLYSQALSLASSNSLIYLSEAFSVDSNTPLGNPALRSFNSRTIPSFLYQPFESNMSQLESFLTLRYHSQIRDACK